MRNDFYSTQEGSPADPANNRFDDGRVHGRVQSADYRFDPSRGIFELNPFLTDIVIDNGASNIKLFNGDFDVGRFNNPDDKTGNDQRYGVYALAFTGGLSVDWAKIGGVSDDVVIKSSVSGPGTILKANAGEGGASLECGAWSGYADTTIGSAMSKTNHHDGQATVGVAGGGVGIPPLGLHWNDSDGDGYREFGAKFGIPIGPVCLIFDFKFEIGVSDKTFEKIGHQIKDVAEDVENGWNNTVSEFFSNDLDRLLANAKDECEKAFAGDIKDFGVGLGGNIEDFGHDIKDFGVELGGRIEDFGQNLGKDIEDVGHDIAKGFRDLFKI